MATPKEINEFEGLGEFFKRLRQDCELQGISFKDNISNDTALKTKFTRLKNLGNKVKQYKKIQQKLKASAKDKKDKEDNEHQMIKSIIKRKNRKRRYSECALNDIKNPHKKLKLSKIRNNVGFSPSFSFNRCKPQTTNTKTTADKENIPNIHSNHKENKENIQSTKRRPLNLQTPLKLQTPSKRNIDHRNKGLLSCQSSLKNRINNMNQNTDDDGDIIIESNRNNINIKKPKQIPQTVKQTTKTRRKTPENNDVEVKPKAKKKRPQTVKKKTKRPQTVKAKTKVTRKTVKKKKPPKTAKKNGMTRRKTKKDGSGVSKNFVKMDLKHNKYRRKGRSNRPSKKKKFKKYNKYEWMEQKRKESVKKTNLNLENMEQLKNEVYSDSDAEPEIDTNIDRDVDIHQNTYCDQLNEIKNDEEIDALLVDVLQKEYGYNEYRKGQKEAIKLILKKESVLLLLSTGAGKSICYQIPTILLKNDNLKPLTLVISPLISLMYDQCNNLPQCLKGRVWDSNLKRGDIYKLREDTVNGKVNILFIAPEKLDNNYFQSFLKNSIGSKRLMFACIDEAHCISEWSHNFRPSYLKLKRILMDYLSVGCILACTATATVITQNSIIDNLNISSNHIVNCLSKRENLHLTVSHIGRGLNKEQKLIALMRTERFRSLKSLIIYVGTRMDVENVARRLGVLKRDNGTSVAGYHGGMKAFERTEVQNGFMSGEINIIVATIAFGMGVNKSDVRGVIHYYVPKSMEQYVQQIGRAGRDGLGSECHLFYDRQDIDRQTSWIHKNGVDLIQIKRLLFDIFSAKNVKTLRNKLKKRNGKKAEEDEDDLNDCDCDELILTEFKEMNDMVTISKNSEIRKKYDAEQAVLETIFTYLDVYKSEYIKLLPSHHNKVKVGITKNLKQLESESEIIRFIVNCYKAKNGIYIVHLNKLYNDLRYIEIEDEDGDIIAIEREYTVYQISQHLKKLEFERKVTLFNEDISWVLMIKKSIKDHDDLVCLCDNILEYVSNHEILELEKINTLAQALKIIANSNEEMDQDIDVEERKTISLHCLVERYFECEDHDEFLDLVQSYLPDYDHIRTVPISKSNVMYLEVKQSIIKFIDEYPKIKRVRIIAKIFHGFGSPLYPFKEWHKRDVYWKKHVNFPFMQIMEIAKEVMMDKQNRKNVIISNDT